MRVFKNIREARKNHRERALKQVYVALQQEWGDNGSASDWLDERMNRSGTY